MMTVKIKKLKEQKNVIKWILKFEEYKKWLLNNEATLKSLQIWSTKQSEAQNVYTEEINNIAFSSNNGKRLQTFHKITSYDANVIFKYKLII